jgi:predicted nuclease of predicted toxin-antitoxin system
MRIILDGNLPRGLGSLLANHSVQTIHERHWSDLDDGPLLDACAGECDVFMTMDRSLRHQQILRGRPFGVLLLRARSNRLADLAALVPALLAALPDMQPGEVRIVGA